MTGGNPELLIRQAGEKFRAGDISGSRVILIEYTRRFDGNADVFVLLGNLEAAVRNYPEAVKHYRQALDIDPARAVVGHKLGELLRRLGRLAEAEDALECVVRADPEHAVYRLSLGRVLNAQAKWHAAEEQFQKTIAVQPDNAEAWLHLGICRHGRSQFGSASEAYRKAIELNPGMADAHASLGKALADCGELEEAEQCYRKALQLDPSHQPSLSGIALMANLRGDYAEALKILEPVVKGSEINPQLLVVYTRLKRRAGDHQEAIEILEDLLPRIGSKVIAVDARFCLGDLYNDLGEYDTAFNYYREGNRAGLAGFDLEQHQSFVNSLITFFDAATISQLPRATLTTERPVFIVGMPRSGTSLVEQILASHPLVYAAGERLAIDQLRINMSGMLGTDRLYPECLQEANTEFLNTAGEQYLETIGGDSKALRVTDKLPANFLHLGLIQLLLPAARVINCTRNSLDTALSCYFQNFGSLMPYTQDLDAIGGCYIEYRRIMDHWKQVLDIPILDICYEELVSDQEGQTQRLLRFLNLPWDDRCLEFYKIDRIVHTASYAQVKEPIYNRSVGRYRHYEKHLDQLKQQLSEYL